MIWRNIPVAPLQRSTCHHKFIVNITFAAFAKNITGSNPDISLGLKFLAKVDEWLALMRANKDWYDNKKQSQADANASSVWVLFLIIKLHLLQFGIIIIPKGHSSRIKRCRHLGTDFNLQISSVARVKLPQRYAADWLWCRITRSGKVCVQGHDKQAHVFVSRVVIEWRIRQ